MSLADEYPYPLDEGLVGTDWSGLSVRLGPVMALLPPPSQLVNAIEPRKGIAGFSDK